jgi:aminobenzoyl-glutamate utilization protein B
MAVRASRFIAATLAVLSSTPALSAELSSQDQAKLIRNVDAYAARMSEVALKIWSLPELGYMETKTSELLQDELKAAGFRIETGVVGIPTAFIARGGSNDGPVIAILA